MGLRSQPKIGIPLQYEKRKRKLFNFTRKISPHFVGNDISWWEKRIYWTSLEVVQMSGRHNSLIIIYFTDIFSLIHSLIYFQIKIFWISLEVVCTSGRHNSLIFPRRSADGASKATMYTTVDFLYHIPQRKMCI